MNRKTVWIYVPAAILVAYGALPAQAQRPVTPVTPVSGADSLFAAVDHWIEQGLLRYEIAGAAVAVVRDGRVVHKRGFGLADVARQYRVDPDTTVFHIASVTKLVTAIAVLQQVDAGKLALNADVRALIGTVHARGWGRHTISLHQLLTHTAGFDTR